MKLIEDELTQKPWGWERLLETTDAYALKIICVRAGHRTSLQSHVQKMETVQVREGRMTLEFGSEPDDLSSREFGPGDGYTLVPGEVHRVTGIEDCVYIEVSTPELNDVIRHADDYGR